MRLVKVKYSIHHYMEDSTEGLSELFTLDGSVYQTDTEITDRIYKHYHDKSEEYGDVYIVDKITIVEHLK